MSYCPTPTKASYPDRIAAEQDLLRIWRRPKRSQTPKRAYLCPCGRWHLTSWEQYDAA